MNITGINLAEILDNIGIPALNEMQETAIEAAKNNNVVLLSATGSGKTLAFLLPILSRLNAAVNTTQALIIAPSRELALQIDQVFRSMRTGHKITCCYGGHLRETEENNLVQPPAVIVGTPGRLADHIRRENITVDTIQTLVLDEFDKSLELGFQDEMEFIIRSLPAITNRMLTSATEAVEIPSFVGMKEEPVKVNFLTDESEDESKLTFRKIISPSRDKIDTLFKLVCTFGGRSSIIFCNHREAVERTSQLLHAKGIVNEFYHGAMEQQQRDSALCKFRNGTANVLVTTDLAARGLDIPNIRYIVHYHIPHTEDSFIHRNGRTARMDATGTVIVLAGPDEDMPGFIAADMEEITLPDTVELPEKPKWTTLFIAAGKKDKVNKVDIVGFLAQKGGLKKDDIGLIEVKDFFAFAAIRKSRASATLGLIKDEKLKNRKIRIEVAK